MNSPKVIIRHFFVNSGGIYGKSLILYSHHARLVLIDMQDDRVHQ